MIAPTLTVLLIEDEPEIRKQIHAMIQSAGWHVAESARGELGLEIAKHIRPAAIVLDLTLPDMSGRAFLEQMKRDILTMDLPVILLTPTPSAPRDVPLELAAGTLSKPVVSERLVTALHDVIRQAPGRTP